MRVSELCCTITRECHLTGARDDATPRLHCSYQLLRDSMVNPNLCRNIRALYANFITCQIIQNGPQIIAVATRNRIFMTFILLFLIPPFVHSRNQTRGLTQFQMHS